MPEVDQGEYLLDTMFDLPSMDGRQVLIDRTLSKAQLAVRVYARKPKDARERPPRHSIAVANRALASPTARARQCGQ